MLYGGTAVALHLGHRVSVDFDFFRSGPLDKKQIETSFAFIRGAETVQEDQSTLVVSATMPSGPVTVSFFGDMTIGRTTRHCGRTIRHCSSPRLEDLLATKLKATLDRAEAKEYRDISAMISAGVSLERGLGASAKMYDKDPGLVLRAVRRSRREIRTPCARQETAWRRFQRCG